MKSDARSRGTKGKTGRKEVGVRIAVRRGGGVTDMTGDCQERRREARMEDGVQDGRGGERSGACHRRRGKRRSQRRIRALAATQGQIYDGLKKLDVVWKTGGRRHEEEVILSKVREMDEKMGCGGCV